MIEACAISDGFSIRALSKRWKVGAGKIRTWIRRGELPALNLSDSPARPLYRITPEAITAFERRRGTTPAPKAPRRRKQPPGEQDFFPGD